MNKSINLTTKSPKENITNTISLPILNATLGPKVIDVRKLYADNNVFTYDPGFTSTASCESKITFIDGNKGILLHRGYRIEELAEKSSFLEVAFLLLNGELPSVSELNTFKSQINSHSMVHEQLKNIFLGFPRNSHPMAMMVGVVGSLSAFHHNDIDNNKPEERERACFHLIGKIPTIASMSTLLEGMKRPPVSVHICR